MQAELCDKCLGTGHAIDHVLLGSAYRAKRHKAKLTLRQMADAMDIDTATLCVLEQGKRNWSSYYAIRFEQALNILGK